MTTPKPDPVEEIDRAETPVSRFKQLLGELEREYNKQAYGSDVVIRALKANKEVADLNLDLLRELKELREAVRRIVHADTYKNPNGVSRFEAVQKALYEAEKLLPPEKHQACEAITAEQGE